MIAIDILRLYRLMLRSRFFEDAVAELWNEGRIFGEMHLGIGEEAIVAGVVSQLEQGDAMALDHRSTPPCIMRGLDPVPLLLEFLGHPRGLCSGMGGHMHIFSKDFSISSSGIVGASGPAAVGFAIASRYRKQNAISVAFLGEGAVNQGMMLESLNLASAWSLPVLFVCKDNDWAITTRSSAVTGGASLVERARGFGIEGISVDGWDVEAVWEAANAAITAMRDAYEPFFLHARCSHGEGHFLGDPLLRFRRRPWTSYRRRIPGLTRSMIGIKGARLGSRLAALRDALSHIAESGEQFKGDYDPILWIEKKLKRENQPVEPIRKTIKKETEGIFSEVMQILSKEEGA